ncbi:hypothetical protein D3C77_643420 [compost metagenome]
MGYRPDLLANVTDVRAKFSDGTIGGGNNTSNPNNPNNPSNPYGKGWGFDVSDIWNNVVGIVSSLGLFLLLGICIKLVPRIFKIIRKAVTAKRGY